MQGTGGYLSGKPFVATIKVDPLQASADVPRPGRVVVDDRRQAGRISLARRRESRRRDRPRAAEPAAARRAADVGLLAPRAVRGPRRQAGRAFHHDARLQRQAARQADLRQHRRRRLSAGRRRRARGSAGLFLLHIRARGSLQPITEDEPEEESTTTTGAHRGHAADPRHRPRLHREAGQGRQPRRLRAVDPHRLAGRGRAHRDDRQQRPADADGHHRRHAAAPTCRGRRQPKRGERRRRC